MLIGDNCKLFSSQCLPGTLLEHNQITRDAETLHNWNIWKYTITEKYKYSSCIAASATGVSLQRPGGHRVVCLKWASVQRGVWHMGATSSHKQEGATNCLPLFSEYRTSFACDGFLNPVQELLTDLHEELLTTEKKTSGDNELSPYVNFKLKSEFVCLTLQRQIFNSASQENVGLRDNQLWVWRGKTQGQNEKCHRPSVLHHLSLLGFTWQG